MEVSVIIAHNQARGEETLRRCMASILREGQTEISASQSLKSKADACQVTEIGACQSSKSYPVHAPMTEIIVETVGNKSESRNHGASIAKGDILVFFDDDAELREGCMNELLKPFVDSKVGIVGGVNIAFPGVSFEEQIGASLLASPLTMFRSASRYTPRGDIRESDEAEILSAVMAVRKEAFNKAGGFPVDIIPCEENVLINNVQKAGYKVIYNPFAVVYHRRPKVFMEYFKTMFNYGKGRGKMMRHMKGGPKMLYAPTKKWPYYVIGFVGHYISYITGVIWGLIS